MIHGTPVIITPNYQTATTSSNLSRRPPSSSSSPNNNNGGTAPSSSPRSKFSLDAGFHISNQQQNVSSNHFPNLFPTARPQSSSSSSPSGSPQQQQQNNYNSTPSSKNRPNVPPPTPRSSSTSATTNHLYNSNVKSSPPGTNTHNNNNNNSSSIFNETKQQFHRGVVDALHSVLKDRRLPSSSPTTGNQTNNKFASPSSPSRPTTTHANTASFFARNNMSSTSKLHDDVNNGGEINFQHQGNSTANNNSNNNDISDPSGAASGFAKRPPPPTPSSGRQRMMTMGVQPFSATMMSFFDSNSFGDDGNDNNHKDEDNGLPSTSFMQQQQQNLSQHSHSYSYYYPSNNMPVTPRSGMNRSSMNNANSATARPLRDPQIRLNSSSRQHRVASASRMNNHTQQGDLNSSNLRQSSSFSSGFNNFGDNNNNNKDYVPPPSLASYFANSAPLGFMTAGTSDDLEESLKQKRNQWTQRHNSNNNNNNNNDNNDGSSFRLFSRSGLGSANTSKSLNQFTSSPSSSTSASMFPPPNNIKNNNTARHDPNLPPSSSSSSSASNDASTSNPDAIAKQQQHQHQIMKDLLIARINSLKTEGNALYAQKRYVEAHQLYSQGIDLDPGNANGNNAILLSNRAAAQICMNNIDAAIRDCQLAVSVDPSFWRAQVRLGRALALKGHFEGAKDVLTRSLKLFQNMNNSNIHKNNKNDDDDDDDENNNNTNHNNSKEREECDEVVQNIKNQLKATEQFEKSKFEYEAGNCLAALNSLNHENFKDSVFVDDLSVRVYKSKLQLILVASLSSPSNNNNHNHNNNCVTNATSLLASCRAELGRYIPTACSVLEAMLNLTFALFPCPTTLFQPLTLPAPLLTNFATGLCDLLVASSKVAVLAGWHHAANARATLRLCFLLRPEFGPAVILERIIASASRHLEEASAAMADGRPAEAHAGLTLALTVDPTNTRLRASVLLLRAEASIALGRYDAAATDCTEALILEPGGATGSGSGNGGSGNNTRALLRRSQSFERGGNFAFAMRDMEMAVEAQPELVEELEALVERIKQVQQQQQQQQKKQKKTGRPQSSSTMNNNKECFDGDSQQQQQETSFVDDDGDDEEESETSKSNTSNNESYFYSFAKNNGGSGGPTPPRAPRNNNNNNNHHQQRNFSSSGTRKTGSFSSAKQRPGSSNTYEHNNTHESNNNNNHHHSSSRPPSSSARNNNNNGQSENTGSASVASTPTLYDVLGVAKDAGQAAIRTQYRKLTLQFHPDKVVTESEQVRRHCEERFKQIAQAYAVVSDEEQRREYDVTLLVNSVLFQ